MSTASPIQESALSRLLTKWKAARGDADRWELVIAADVIALEAQWDQLRDEARKADERRGPDFPTWLNRTFGSHRSIAYWKRHAEAVSRIGEHARRRWHSKAAVWALRFDDVTLRRLDRAVGDEWRLRSEGDASYPVLPPPSVVRIAAALGAYQPGASKHSCKRCEALELLLMEHGIEAPDGERVAMSESEAEGASDGSGAQATCAKRAKAGKRWRRKASE